MPTDPSLPPKVLLVGSGPHLSSARLMVGEAGLTIAEEITHPGVSVTVLDKLKTDDGVHVSLVALLLSDTHRDKEGRVITELRREYPDCKILCVGPSDDNARRSVLLSQGVTAYVGFTDGWVSAFYDQLVELRKAIQASK